jgi:hypothetical protein
MIGKQIFILFKTLRREMIKNQLPLMWRIFQYGSLVSDCMTASADQLPIRELGE